MDVDGNLTVESVQDRSKNNSWTLGVSAGYGADNTNGGINGNMSKGSSKWVAEQTSLTGGTVNIDVAEKTALRGAVIASDTGDLTLATGSLEYSHIKDRNSSTNFGGGISGSTGNKNVDAEKGVSSASYGFSDSRQTNFATIGEGEITIRDGSSIGSPDDYNGLKRDVSKAQYGSVSLGVQLSADKSTIDLLTNPADTFNDTMKGLDQIADRGKKIEEQTHVVEKKGNLYKSLDAGDGLTWENNDERLDRLVVKYSKHDDAEDAYGAYEGETNSDQGKVINGNYDEGNSDKLAFITDSDEMGQSSIKLKETVGEVFDDIREDDSEMRTTIIEFDEMGKGLSERAEKAWRQFDPDGRRVGDADLSEKQLADLKKNDYKGYLLYTSAKNLGTAAAYYESSSSRVDSVLTYIKTEDRNVLINDTVKNLCNVEVYWEYGTVVGKENRTFQGFYGYELVKGNIGNVNEGKANAYWGTGGNEWAEKYGINSLEGSKNVRMGEDKIQNLLNNNTTGYAIIYKDKNDKKGPDHYSIIKKDNDGVWYDYDHNRRKAPDEVDFSKVYKINQEIIKQGKNQ